ncbi:MAG TPA: PP2C family protein-serine/threonine phosphatase [Nocardioidaceae bacterium]|nr:PP2C family protein-serine/threonine phosphatase [Nocardioidaceae bacterium]
MRKRLLLLAMAGVLMTLAVAVAAELCLAELSTINRQLAQVSHAQRFHQDADMLHDAMRADVARAQLAGSGTPGLSPAAVRRETARHAADYRKALRAVESLSLSADLEQALDRLRPAQRTYVTTAESLVQSALANGGRAPAALVGYEAAFQQLVQTQSQVTDQLLATSDRVERDAAAEKQEADRMIATATLAALAGWLALVAWHMRSIRSLHRALVREAEQRSAADLLQRTLLPTALPTVPGLALAARSVPGSVDHRVGGDWYDVVTLPTGEVCLVVGDVVGHDLSAASGMGQLRNALRAYALEKASPASILRRVNRAAHLMDVSDLATCICVVLDPATLVVRWASAGHLPPLLATAPGARRLLTGQPGPPLGVIGTARYPQHELQLRPGDNLLLYSDGLVERRSAPIDAGLTALETVPISNWEPDAICDQLLSTLLSDGSDHDDDVTLLLLQVSSPPPVAEAGLSTAPAEV